MMDDDGFGMNGPWYHRWKLLGVGALLLVAVSVIPYHRGRWVAPNLRDREPSEWAFTVTYLLQAVIAIVIIARFIDLSRRKNESDEVDVSALAPKEAVCALEAELESHDVDGRVEVLNLLDDLGRRNRDVRGDVVDVWRRFLIRAERDVEIMRDAADHLLAQRLLLKRTRDAVDRSGEKVRGSWAASIDTVTLHGVVFVDVDFSRRSYSILDFEGARFVGDTSFRSTRFNRGANFDGARFVGPVDFGRARFHDEVSFDGAEFHDGADFTGARFRSTVDVEAAVVTGDLVFDGARFTGAARFTNLILEGAVTVTLTDAEAHVPVNGTDASNAASPHVLPSGWVLSDTASDEWRTVVATDLDATDPEAARRP